MLTLPQSVTSCQLSHSFAIDQIRGEYVTTLSVFNDKLLVSCGYRLSQLFIIGRDGCHLSTISTINNETLCDAIWTPRGNIIYTTDDGNKVIVMSDIGSVISIYKKLTDPRYLSLCGNDIIYLTDWETGVFQSTDDGISWSLVFKSTDGRHCEQVIKVAKEHSDDFWTLEKSGNKYHLRVYSVDRQRLNGNEVKWMDINVTTTDGKNINLRDSSLAYDGRMNIFLSDRYNKTVHLLSSNGQYLSQLLPSGLIRISPCKLAVDRERRLLYIGQAWGIMGVFELAYGDRDD